MSGTVPVRMGRWTARSGMTLIEIIIAMAIMSVGLLGYFSLHARAMQSNHSAANMTQATNIAVAMTEMLESVPFSPDTNSDSMFLNASAPDSAASCCDDLATVLSPVNAFNTTDPTQGPLNFERSYSVTLADDTQDAGEDKVPSPSRDTVSGNPVRLRYVVRVRYPAEDGYCPSCTNSDLRSGFRAVTLTMTRAATAY